MFVAFKVARDAPGPAPFDAALGVRTLFGKGAGVSADLHGQEAGDRDGARGQRVRSQRPCRSEGGRAMIPQGGDPR